MSWSHDVELRRYRELISAALAQRNEPQSEAFEIALADLVPGIAFREIWPLATLYSPLRPYLRDKVLNHDYIPRKSDPLTAVWLTRSLAGFGDVEYPNSLKIAYVGDSSSDLTLAQNLAKRSDPATGFGVHVTLYLYDPDNVRDETVSPTFRLVGLPTWTAIEEACRFEMTKRAFGSDNFLLLDVDRTLLLPRGLCDVAFDGVGATAVKRFVNWFACESPISESVVAEAFTEAKQFPPYSRTESPYHNDEDVRAIACLLLCAGMLAADGFGRNQPHLKDWLPSSLENLDTQRWSRERFADYIEDLRMSLFYRDCTLALYFREMEHEVMLEMADVGSCSLNGHAVRMIATALDNNWTPVAYSDRPGSSVGLALRSYYRSRPILSRRSLIETELPLKFETVGQAINAQ